MKGVRVGIGRGKGYKPVGVGGENGCVKGAELFKGRRIVGEIGCSRVQGRKKNIRGGSKRYQTKFKKIRLN